MSTKAPLIVSKTTRRYKLFMMWSHDHAPTKVWHFRFGYVMMSVVYVCCGLMVAACIIAMTMIILTLASPIYLYLWPDNRFFELLHERLWPDVSLILPISAVLLALILLIRWQQNHLKQFGNWLLRHKPAGRPIKIIDD